MSQQFYAHPSKAAGKRPRPYLRGQYRRRLREAGRPGSPAPAHGCLCAPSPGPDRDEQEEMLQTVGVESLDQLIDQTIPAPIRLRRPLALPGPRPESDVLDEMAEFAGSNPALPLLYRYGLL